MRYYPLNYDQINLAAGSVSPSATKSINNRTFAFWTRALFDRAVSVIDLTVPQEWEGKIKDFLHYCLFRYGFVVISKNEKYGQFFQPATLYGYNFYYQPVRALIANPLDSYELEIGTECELLKITPDYRGIWDILEYYAEKLSLLDNAINMSLINSKLAYVLAGKTKAAVQALKKMMDLINKGESAVYFDSELMDEPQSKDSPFQFLSTGDMVKNYLTTNQLADFQTILHNFDSEIGIPSLPYQKKERLVSAEATMRGYDSQARALVWIETLKSSINEVKRLYPDIRLDAELHYKDAVENAEGVENE